MIHVDVKRDPDFNWAYIVQTSTDGAGWKTQYVCATSKGDHPDRNRIEAEHTARVMRTAWEYAGIECRATSCGYSL